MQQRLPVMYCRRHKNEPTEHKAVD